ncbi:MAG: hypothetical protein IH964_07530 [Candidatus Dadabacteria bacterium]|nr:hypothetical protein [Candidatus Dadabacteria bacterium]
MDLRVRYIAGLRFTPNSYVTIKRSGEALVFEGIIEKESIRGFKGVNEGKKEKIEIKVRIHIADIMSVKLSPSVESSSDYGTVKNFHHINDKD